MERKTKHGKRKPSQHKHKVSHKNKNSKDTCKDMTAFRYYGTDEEEYTYHSLHTYSTTSFPLFSISDDELFNSSPENGQKTTSREKKHRDQLDSPQPLERPEKSRKRSPVDKSLLGFPFNQLPNELKVKIFSYLSNVEKGLLQRTCTLWRKLLQTPSLWTNVSFSEFPIFCTRDCELRGRHFNCYPNYKKRVQNFFEFLMKINPFFRKLDIKLDIGDPNDEYCLMLQHLVEKGNLSELKILNLNWKDTPAKTFWIEDRQNMSSSDIVFSHRHRSRLFCTLFDDWTKKSPKITTLALQFDWLGRSIDSITRLSNLETLIIEKYFVIQPIEQSMLDKLLSGLPNLKRLMLEVWSPSGPGLRPFSMVSKSLEFLDVGQSRGFYLRYLDMPKLTTFHVSRQPWNGPLVCTEHVQIPCIYNVLVRGARNLKKINEHYLEKGWELAVYPTLYEVLKGVCSCKKHKFDWDM